MCASEEAQQDQSVQLPLGLLSAPAFLPQGMGQGLSEMGVLGSPLRISLWPAPRRKHRARWQSTFRVYDPTLGKGDSSFCGGGGRARKDQRYRLCFLRLPLRAKVPQYYNKKLPFISVIQKLLQSCFRNQRQKANYFNLIVLEI